VSHSTRQQNALLRRGYSRHLGGPWYIARLPDSGRLYYARDAGTGTVEIPLHQVPADVRRKGGL
jgi:hypothetical protein